MKIINIIILLLLTSQLPAQQAFQWAVSSGGEKDDVVNAIVGYGNDIYVTGKYVDKFISGGKEVESAGAADIYLTKLNSSGKTQWVKNIGGAGTDEATCLTVSNDNLYIGGQVSGSVMFDKDKFAGEGKSLFAAKCTNKGKPEWFKQFNVEGHATLDVLECDPNGNLLLGGMLYGTLDAGVSVLKSTGVSRAFTIRLSPEGEPQSALLSSGKGNHRLISAAFASDGGKYFLFSISGQFNFGRGASSCSSGNVSRGVVLVKTSTEDEVQWHKVYDCPDYSEGIKVVADNEGGVFTVTNFTNEFNTSDTTLLTEGQLETAIVSYNQDGTLNWIQQIKSPVKCKTFDAVLTHSGDLMVTGFFRNGYSCSDISHSETEMTGDLFLLQFDKQGEPVWHDESGEEAASFSKAITLDKDGNVILAGAFRGELSIGGTNLEPIGRQDILVAKYFNCLQNSVVISDDSPLCPGGTKELKASSGFDTYLWNSSFSSHDFLIESPGKYYVEAMDELGCYSSDTIIIMQADVNELYIAGDTIINEGEAITLSASQGFAYYQWEDGYLGMERTVEFDPDADSAVFRLTVQNDFGCSACDTITVWYNKIEDKSGGDINSFKSHYVYPNPVNERLYWYIETKNSFDVIVQLSDGKGVLVYEQEISNYIPYSKQEIDMMGFASGNYLLSLILGDIVLNEKIVKK